MLNETVTSIGNIIDESKFDRTEKETVIYELQKNVMDMFVTIKSIKRSSSVKERLLTNTCSSGNRKRREDQLVIDSIKEKMGEEIKRDSKDRSPRLGASMNNGKSRPVIIKLARYNICQRNIKKYNKIKRKILSITEGMTKKTK